MEDGVILAAILLGTGIGALLWPRPGDLSDGLRLAVTLIALIAPFTALASAYLVSRAFGAHITARCRPGPRTVRSPSLVIFVAMYLGLAVVGGTVFLRVLSALLLVASLVLYPALWRFAQRFPIKECESS